jgi:hypothetical protein
MAEYDDEPCAEPLGSELNATDLRGSNDIAGDADDEKIAEALVEHDLGGRSRVGATENYRKRLLAG